MKSQLGRKHHKITIAQWNVRTLLDRETTNRPESRTALVAMELAKYNIDIAVLSETRFHASGSLNDLEYTFYWSGKPNGERREAGVGFAIKRDIVAKLTEIPHPVSDRIMTMRIPLTKDRNATIVSAYAPTMTNPEENKETFYSQLKSTLGNIPSTNKLLLIGDFNAMIGRENDKWPSALGKYGIGKCNSNGELLLALCTEFDLLLLLFAMIRSVVKSFKVPDVEVAAARMSNESALTHDLLDTKKNLVRLDAGPGWMS